MKTVLHAGVYGMRTEDEIVKIFRKWFSDILAVLRNMHNLLVLVRDNAGENKSKNLMNSSNQKESRIISALRMRL
jgi:hypothetical protein